MAAEHPTPEDEFHTEQLFAKVQQGDQIAAQEVFERYFNRLVRLAANRLSQRMKQRLDPEDVVQSAMRSFFCHANEGRYVVERSGDLWRLLAAITRNKVLKKLEFHQQKKRDIQAEQQLPHTSDHSSVQLSDGVFATDAGELEAFLFADEIETVMNDMTEQQQLILQLRLLGHSTAEIAKEINRTDRTVRRILADTLESLRSRLGDDA